MKNNIRIITAISILALTAVFCTSLTPTQAPVPTALPPIPTAAIELPTQAPTEAQPAPAATDTVQAAEPTAASPTLTATPVTPTATATQAAATGTLIQFPANGTYKVVEGNFTDPNGGVKKYQLRAAAGQIMMVDVSSAKQVALSISGVQDGASLLKAAANWTSWTGTLPKTEDYTIGLHALEATHYSLNVIIPRTVKFNAGAISTSFNGMIYNGIDYNVLRAAANQTMTVTISSPGPEIALEIYGIQDGQPLIRHVADATSWTGTLPATQDYAVNVFAVAGTSTSYTMHITIE